MLINWGSGYFSGLKLGFIFIILGIEFYFLLFEKWTEREINIIQLIILSFSCFLGFLVGVIKISILSIFFLPFAYIVILGIENFNIRKEENIQEKESIKRYEKAIEKNPQNWAAYLSLGDIYFKKDDFEKASYYYQKAFLLRDEPVIKQKLKTAERENKIKMGEIWICPECGEENNGEENKCKNCGYEKDIIKSVKKDIKEKSEIKKYLVLLIISPIAIGIILLLIKFLPLYFSIFLTIGIIYFLLKLFFSW